MHLQINVLLVISLFLVKKNWLKKREKREKRRFEIRFRFFKLDPPPPPPPCLDDLLKQQILSLRILYFVVSGDDFLYDFCNMALKCLVVLEVTMRVD